MTADDVAEDDITRWGKQGNANRLLELSAILRALQALRRNFTPPHIPFEQVAELSSTLVDITGQILSAGPSGDQRFDAAVAGAARHGRNVGLCLHRAGELSEESPGLVRQAIAEREKCSAHLDVALGRLKTSGFPVPDAS
jgi:hypothetical protein